MLGYIASMFRECQGEVGSVLNQFATDGTVPVRLRKDRFGNLVEPLPLASDPNLRTRRTRKNLSPFFLPLFPRRGTWLEFV